MTTKRDGFDRYYFINPNGVSHHRDMLDFSKILSSLRSNEVDIFGLSETNLDFLQPDIRKRCETLLNDFYQPGMLATSTNQLASSSSCKPGGTITGITNNLCGRFQSSGSDPHGLGRWSFIRLYGQGGTSLVVVTAYRVCNASIGSSGLSTAFHQQWHLLRTAGDLNPNPRKQFITDLIIEIQKWKAEGAEVLLGGDFNDELGSTQDGRLSNLVTTCGLVDLHAVKHGTTNVPNTYSRGKYQVDYLLCTPKVTD
jgi:hypothetical protein